MTRKDYQLIAKVFNDFSKVIDLNETVGAEIALCLADDFANDNPRFDRTKFLTACGLEQN